MHWTRNLASCALALSIGAFAPSLGAQSAPPKADTAASANEQNWWKNAVIYEIYPRSFQDTNGDGIGDLNGITERLDYLKNLGVDAIWLTPVYPSPQVDFGYDISDYENIDPQYGTLKDFDHLVAEADKRHIRIIMDMVMNHTSDKHKWFLESRSSRNNPYRDWYMWHDGKGETATSKGEPPNNWQSDFGHSAWEWDEKTRQYYYHKFYIQQPDVNWNNPKVHQAFKDIIAFWLKRGVGGFRFDAITTLYEDPEMRDEDVLLDKNGKSYLNDYGDIALNDTRTNNLPGTHPVMQEMRAFSDTFDSNKFPGDARAHRRDVPAQHRRACQAIWNCRQARVSTAHGHAGRLHQQARRGHVPRPSSTMWKPRSTATFRCWSSTTTTIRASTLATATAFTTPISSASSPPCSLPAAGPRCFITATRSA